MDTYYCRVCDTEHAVVALGDIRVIGCPKHEGPPLLYNPGAWGYEGPQIMFKSDDDHEIWLRASPGDRVGWLQQQGEEMPEEQMPESIRVHLAAKIKGQQALKAAVSGCEHEDATPKPLGDGRWEVTCQCGGKATVSV